MNEADYQDLVDRIFADIEDLIDENDLDVDVDASGGLVNVTFADGSSVILSRQPAAQEIWVAARSGGFHLARQDGVWATSGGETLTVLLNRVFTEQSGDGCTLFSDLQG